MGLAPDHRVPEQTEILTLDRVDSMLPSASFKSGFFRFLLNNDLPIVNGKGHGSPDAPFRLLFIP